MTGDCSTLLLGNGMSRDGLATTATCHLSPFRFLVIHSIVADTAIEHAAGSVNVNFCTNFRSRLIGRES